MKRLLKHIGIGAGNFVAGAGRTAWDLSGNFFAGRRISDAEKRYMRASEVYSNHLQKVKTSSHPLDCVLVGGELLSRHLFQEGNVPEVIEEAYRAAYPVESMSQTFVEKVKELDSDALRGLVAGVKGKLFEAQYVDHLNNGVLPDGYVAELAESATQPGWDVVISGPDIAVVEQIQLKATDSVHLVTEALQRYPDIDVVTTAEVYDQLMAIGMTEGIVNSGVSDAALEAFVSDAAESANDHAMDWMPPVLTAAIIAFSSYRKKDLDEFARTRGFGERFGRSYVYSILGGAASAVTGVGVAGLITVLATGWLSSRGRKKRELVAGLSERASRLEYRWRKLEEEFAWRSKPMWRRRLVGWIRRNLGFA